MHSVGQAKAEQGDHPVGAVRTGKAFVGYVAGVVDDIRVISGKPAHQVRARAAIKRIGAGTAGQRVGKCAAGNALHADEGVAGRKSAGRDAGGQVDHDTGGGVRIVGDIAAGTTVVGIGAKAA